MRNQFRYHGGRYMCGQINILVALTDIGPGDGGTMLIPGSHKSNFTHPDLDRHRMKPEGATVEGITGAIECQNGQGRRSPFRRCLSHGSARRQNEGTRRIFVYRYGPSWGNFRHGYHPSAELLARLTPERRRSSGRRGPVPQGPQKKLLSN